MKKKIIFGFIFILLVSMIHLIPFRTSEQTIQVQNTQRSYYLHLPTGYDSSKKYPLVIMIHGYTDHPLLAELYSGMSKKADKEKFIVVYPKGTSDAQDSNLSWNAEFCCGGAKRQKSDDVTFIDTLLDEVTTNYAVDTKKVYVSGFSNGAMFVHLLGTKLASRITAIAAIGGSIGSNNTFTNTNSPVPILIMNGNADRTVPFAGGGVYASAAEAVTFWKEINNASQEKIYKEPSYTKSSYATTEGKEMVVFYEIHGGRHVWFWKGWDVTKILFNQPILTTEEIWDFFKKHES